MNHLKRGLTLKTEQVRPADDDDDDDDDDDVIDIQTSCLNMLTCRNETFDSSKCETKRGKSQNVCSLFVC